MLSCPHGVTYGWKILTETETNRDHADLLRRPVPANIKYTLTIVPTPHPNPSP